MNSKIIFFDIDGTILSHRNNRISDSTKAAIKQAQANGHLAFVNTGRTIAEIEGAIMEIGFDGYVCGCGSYISYHDSVLLQASIPSNIIKRLLMDLRRYNIEAILEGSTALYYNYESTNPLLTRLKNSQENDHHFNVKSWDDPDISFDKFCIWPTTEEGSKMFYEEYKEIFDFISRENRLYEVVPKNHSKASGIEFLLSHLDIPHENTYALGDGANDLTMLEFVHHSIGMGNSSDDIKGIVSYLTKDVDQDGVAVALKHFNII
ncbi:MAG: HAD family hydrolase [Mobilitalea sp.]